MMRRTVQGMAFRIGGMVALLTVAACSTPSPAEQAWNDATNACERLRQTDQRQTCFEAAMRQYQAALAKENAKRASCPPASC